MTDRIVETTSRPARESIAGFLVAGGIATASHWGVMWVLMTADFAPLHATAFGSLLGAAVNYGLQRRLAFDYHGSHAGAAPRYLLACAAAWLLNLLVFQCLHAAAGLPAGIAQFMTTAIVSLMSYLVYRRLVFHD